MKIIKEASTKKTTTKKHIINQVRKIIKEEIKNVLFEKFESIGSGRAYSNAGTLYYDKTKKQFMTPNFWNGSPTIMNPNNIKWGDYNLTPLGKQLMKKHKGNINKTSPMPYD